MQDPISRFDGQRLPCSPRCFIVYRYPHGHVSEDEKDNQRDKRVLAFLVIVFGVMIVWLARCLGVGVSNCKKG